MKLKVINFDSKNVFGSIKQAVFTSALSYAKMYELLHKQIWRKAPYRMTIATLPALPTFNGRPVGFVRKWDIKSPSRSAYSYDGGDHTFGLNQLFVGQDYRKEYQGDPKSGIYHDDCYIAPKSISPSNISSGYKHRWAFYYISNDGEADYKVYPEAYRYYREDNSGTVVINNVSIEYYSIENIHYRRIVIEYATGEINYIELGNYDPSTYLGEGVEYYTCSLTFPQTEWERIFQYKMWYNSGISFDNHGAIVAEYDTVLLTFTSTTYWFSGQSSGWIRVYEDGTVIQFTPSYKGGKDGMKTYPAKYVMLPMIYLDTGDLAMDRVEFVDKWDEYFELFVHEDSEWWTGLIKPVAIIVVAIITYYTWGATNGLLAAVVAIGGSLTIVGIITDNNDLMLIGGIMMAVGSIYTAVAEMAANSAAEAAALSTMSAEQALYGTSFASTFSGYASAAGMENLVAMPTVEMYTSAALVEATGIPLATTSASEMSLATSYSMMNLASKPSLFDTTYKITNEAYKIYNNSTRIGTGQNSSSTASKEDNTNSMNLIYEKSEKSKDKFDPNSVIDIL